MRYRKLIFGVVLAVSLGTGMHFASQFRVDGMPGDGSVLTRATRLPGDPVPDFTLVDHTGRTAGPAECRAGSGFPQGESLTVVRRGAETAGIRPPEGVCWA